MIISFCFLFKLYDPSRLPINNALLRRNGLFETVDVVHIFAAGKEEEHASCKGMITCENKRENIYLDTNFNFLVVISNTNYSGKVILPLRLVNLAIKLILRGVVVGEFVQLLLRGYDEWMKGLAKTN